MSDNAKFTGVFSGIHFGVKQKKGELVQTAGLVFDVELDETSVAQVTGVVRWQKQQVHLDVSRRQPGLFDGKAPPQGELPLTGRNGDRPEATPPPAPAASPPAGSIRGGDPTVMWHEVLVAGEDGKDRKIFKRMDGKAFACWLCGCTFPLKPGEILPDAIELHACSADDRACRVCGCVEDAPCPEGCFWVEYDLCSNPECLEAAGYSPERIAKVEAGEVLAEPEVSQMEMTVKVPCNDGVVREFSYSLEHYQAERGAAFDCEACGEVTEIEEGDQREFYPIPLMAAHVCPPVCHKCHAKMKFGEAFAGTLRFHHPECGKAAIWNPETAVATALDVQGADPYARRVEDAPSARAREFLLEDATEAFARIEEECGLTRSMGRTDVSTYKAAHSLTKKDRKAVLAAVKKVSKGAWNRMEVLLQDIDAAKAEHDAIARKEQEEQNRAQRQQRDRERAAKDRVERERIEKILAGESQPYDEMLRLALTRGEDSLEEWNDARSHGLDHQELLAMTRAALRPDGGHNVPGQTSVSCKVGYHPEFWFGPATGKPTLEGPALADAVRRVMQIPAEKDEPEDTDEEVEEVAEADARLREDSGAEEEPPVPLGDTPAVDPSDPAVFSHMLRYALCRGKSAEASWEQDRKEGLSDADLRVRIGVEFGGAGGGCAKPGYPPVAYKGGDDPEFWYDHYTRNKKGTPTLTRKALVDAVRVVMKIPFPAGEGA